MKRQAISICLDTLKELESQIRKEIDDIMKITKLKGNNINRIGISFPIVNYPTKLEGVNKEIYCSDTWKFESVKLKSIKNDNDKYK